MAKWLWFTIYPKDATRDWLVKIPDDLIPAVVEKYRDYVSDNYGLTWRDDPEDMVSGDTYTQDDHWADYYTFLSYEETDLSVFETTRKVGLNELPWFSMVPDF